MEETKLKVPAKAGKKIHNQNINLVLFIYLILVSIIEWTLIVCIVVTDWFVSIVVVITIFGFHTIITRTRISGHWRLRLISISLIILSIGIHIWINVCLWWLLISGVTLTSATTTAACFNTLDPHT